VFKRIIAIAFLSASTLAAQTASGCRQQGQAEQTRLINADRAAGRALDATAIVAASRKVMRDCAEKIDESKASVRERSDLASLWISTGDTSRAERIVNELLGQQGSESDRADARIAGIRLAIAKWDAFAGANPEGERLVRQLDGLSDAVMAQKITGHASLLGRYEYADLDEPIRAQATQLLALTKRAVETNALPMTEARPAQGSRPAVPSYNPAYVSMLSAYQSLARTHGDFLHADSALMVLEEAERVVGPSYPYASASIAGSKAMYKLVGESATPIDGKWWVNAADGSVVKPGNGRISIVQFTAHWCVPCKKSYEPMNRLMAKYKGKPVESIMATNLYGYIGTKRNLTPEQEVAADRDYFAVEHKLASTVAINPSTDPRAPEYAATNDGRYAVGGIPEIVIIDRKGVIRATVVGWDRGNEARFAAFIDKLLAEK